MKEIEDMIEELYNKMRIKKKPNIIKAQSLLGIYKAVYVGRIAAKNSPEYLGKSLGGRLRDVIKTDHSQEIMWCTCHSDKDAERQVIAYHAGTKVPVANRVDFMRGVIRHGDGFGSESIISQITKKVESWMPFWKGVFIVEEKPLYIKRKEGRLHCKDGPVMEYADGFKMYALQDIPVTEKMLSLIKNKNVLQLISIRNVEQQRVVMEEIGMDFILERLNAKRIDRSDYGELYEVDLTQGSTSHWDHQRNSIAKYVKVIDPSSERVYFNRVPSDKERVIDALAWRFNCTPEEYVFKAEA